jgi:primosomal protein N' (replication factor Y)
MDCSATARKINVNCQLLLLHESSGEVDHFFEVIRESCPGVSVAKWHGAMEECERDSVLNGFRSSEISIVVGTGPAVFLPAANLCAIVVCGEENPAHFHSRHGMHFHCRDVAIERAKLENIKCLLLSQSPSVEMYHAAICGSIKMEVEKDECRSGPTVSIIDQSRLDPGKRLLSPQILRKIEDAMETGKKNLLIHPRGGFSRSYCPRCEELFRCPQCDTPLTCVALRGGHICNRCKTECPPNQRCHRCRGRLRRIGAGIGKVKSLLHKYFPSAIFGSSDSGDATADCDILLAENIDTAAIERIGPATVALLDGDNLFCGRSFRSNERAHQLLWRIFDAIGEGGELLLQTTKPECAPLKHFLGGSRTSFCEEELVARRQLGYPPYRHLVVQNFSSGDGDGLKNFATRWGSALNNLTDCQWSGPKFSKCGGKRSRSEVEFCIFTADPAKFMKSLGYIRKEIGISPKTICEKTVVDPC